MAKPMTEAQILAMLRKRVEGQSGNGPTTVLVSHVKDAAGHASRRTLDAVAMGLWPSRGLVIDGFEIKCSRGDWLRELRAPEKADGFIERVDRFWLVVADEGMVRPGELPATWGMLAVRRGRLHEIAEAPLLRLDKASKTAPLPPGIERSYLAALLRATARVGMVPDDVKAAAIEDAVAEARERVQDEVETLRAQMEKARGTLDRFSEAAGIRLADWTPADQVKRIGEVVRAVMDGSERRRWMREGFERQGASLRELLEMNDRALKALDEMKEQG